MKYLQYGKSAAWKEGNTKKVYVGNSKTWKDYDTEKLQHEKSIVTEKNLE